MRWKPILWTVGLGCCGCLFPLGSEGASGWSPRDDARRILQNLQAEECKTRVRAVTEYLIAPGEYRKALARESETLSGPLRERTDLLQAFLAEKDEVRARALGEWHGKFLEARQVPDPATRFSELDRVGLELLAIVTNPAERFLTRWEAARTASYYARRVERPDALSWVPAIPRLLESGEARDRLVGAMLAGRRWLREEDAPEVGLVVPEIITGLRSETFAERYNAYEALVGLTRFAGEGYCVDTLESPEVTAAALAAWERWWAASKERLAHERIPQILQDW
jgi:hypothetical protein